MPCLLNTLDMWIKRRNLWIFFGRLCPASTSAVWSAMLELAVEPPLESLLLQVVLPLLVTPQVTKQSISQRYICCYITIMWMQSWAIPLLSFSFKFRFHVPQKSNWLFSFLLNLVCVVIFDLTTSCFPSTAKEEEKKEEKKEESEESDDDMGFGLFD